MSRGVLSVVLAATLALQGLVAPYSALAAQLSECAAAEADGGECPCCTECPGGTCDCMTALHPATIVALTNNAPRLFLAPAAGEFIEFQAAALASQTYAPLNPPPIR